MYNLEQDEYKLAYEWLQELDEGQPASHLARIIGVSPKTVTRWRKFEPDWETRRVGRIPQESLTEAEKLLNAGNGYAATSRDTGISCSALMRRFPGKAWKAISDDQWMKIEEYLDEGLSYAEIERTIGVSVDAIANHFPGRGWNPEQIIEHARAIRDFNKNMRKVGI